MKYKIEIAPLSDYYVIAVKDKETLELKDIFTLNESGADMLRLFYQDKDISEVAKEMAALYEIPLNIVAKDVQKFAEEMKKKRLL